jgi:hypothetical protein
MMATGALDLAALTPADMVDLDRYPITDLDGPRGQALAAQGRAALHETGAWCLAGFLRAEVVPAMAREAESLVPLAYPGPTEATPYFYDYEAAGFPDGHPRRRTTPRRLSQIACDLIPEDTAIRRLYGWDAIPAFLARVLGLEQVYRSADPYQALNISVMEEGGQQQWHFDTNESNVTLLLQAAEGGGEFEWVPRIRSDADERYDAVGRVLDGVRDGVRALAIEPGMLMLFRGRNSLHRVAPTRGRRRRLQTILGYNAEPGRVGSLRSSVLHYGPRVAARAAGSPDPLAAP